MSHTIRGGSPGVLERPPDGDFPVNELGRSGSEINNVGMGVAMRVLIVDDHPIFRRGIAELINEEGDMKVAGEASNTIEAIRMVAEMRPDVVVVDLSLQDGHGIELIEQISQRVDGPQMIVCSMHDESLFAERALRAGAMGYVNKQETSERLVDAIRRVQRGEVVLSPKMTRKLLHNVVGGKTGEQSPMESLSNREFEVFEMIGEGLTTKQIAARLDLSPKTVEAHREKIKTKLGLANSAQLSRRAFLWVYENRSA
jgi:DNA-binding NarL/FixJ family response regulator